MKSGWETFTSIQMCYLRHDLQNKEGDSGGSHGRAFSKRLKYPYLCARNFVLFVQLNKSLVDGEQHPSELKKFVLRLEKL